MIRLFDIDPLENILPGDIINLNPPISRWEVGGIPNTSILIREFPIKEVRFLLFRKGNAYRRDTYYFEQIGEETPEFYFDFLKKYYDPDLFRDSSDFFLFSRIGVVDNYNPLLFSKRFRRFQDWFNDITRGTVGGESEFWLSYLILRLLDFSYFRVSPGYFKPISRGIGVDEYTLQNFLDSDKFCEAAIASWTHDPKISNLYSKGKQFGIIFQIDRPTGFRVIGRGKTTESEVYLPMFSRLRYVEKMQEDKTLYIKCEQYPPHPRLNLVH